MLKEGEKMISVFITDINHNRITKKVFVNPRSTNSEAIHFRVRKRVKNPTEAARLVIINDTQKTILQLSDPVTVLRGDIVTIKIRKPRANHIIIEH